MDTITRDSIWLLPDFLAAGSDTGTLAVYGNWKPASLDSSGVALAVAEAEAELVEEAAWYRYVLLCMLGWTAYSLLVSLLFSTAASHSVAIARIVGPAPVLFALSHQLAIVLTVSGLPLAVWVAIDWPKYVRRGVVPARRLLELRLAIDERGFEAVREMQDVLSSGRYPLVSRIASGTNRLSNAIAAAQQTQRSLEGAS